MQDKYRTDGQIIENLWSISRGRLLGLKARLVSQVRPKGASVEDLHINRDLTSLEA